MKKQTNHFEIFKMGRHWWHWNKAWKVLSVRTDEEKSEL